MISAARIGDFFASANAAAIAFKTGTESWTSCETNCEDAMPDACVSRSSASRDSAVKVIARRGFFVGIVQTCSDLACFHCRQEQPRSQPSTLVTPPHLDQKAIAVPIETSETRRIQLDGRHQRCNDALRLIHDQQEPRHAGVPEEAPVRRESLARIGEVSPGDRIESYVKRVDVKHGETLSDFRREN